MIFFNKKNWSQFTILHKSAFIKKIGKQGFTLVELLFVVTIIGFLSTILAPSAQELIMKVRISRTVAEISALERAIGAYVAINHGYPVALTDIDGTVPTDLWGRPFVYTVLGTNPGDARINPHTGLPLNSLITFDLYSKGADGLTAPQLDAAGAEDDIVRALDGAYVGLASEF